MSMTELVLASRNRKKIEELRTLLSVMPDVRVLSLDDVGYSDDIVENGNSFTENALIKARVGTLFGKIGIADDSGLVVDALGGAPGVYSARYSGPGATDSRNNEKLIREMQGIPEEKRTARYIAAIACVFPDGRSFTVQESCEGRILTQPRGENGFGYDPYFLIPDRGLTFAEMSAEDKHRISHRGKAMRRFAHILSYYTEATNADK